MRISGADEAAGIFGIRRPTWLPSADDAEEDSRTQRDQLLALQAGLGNLVALLSRTPNTERQVNTYEKKEASRSFAQTNSCGIHTVVDRHAVAPS